MNKHLRASIGASIVASTILLGACGSDTTETETETETTETETETTETTVEGDETTEETEAE